MSNEDINEKIVWDEDILIKSYTQSVELQPSDLAQRIAMATNSSRQNTNDEEKSPTPDASKKENIADYKVGDCVRCTFEDGIDYEAKIVEINVEEGTCRLCYVGYGNYQEVKLADLVPSWGKKARRLQYEQSKLVCDSTANEGNERVDSAGSGAEKTKKTKRSGRRSNPSNLFNFGSLPPKPPMPPMMFDPNKGEDTEHLSAMLMSWYISGYYTGLYQGIKQAKKTTKGRSKH